MPQDFDPDKFMAARKGKKVEAEPTTFDPDEFMRQRQEPKTGKLPPRVVLPTERQEFNLPRLDSGSRLRFERPLPPRPIETPNSTTGPLAESLRSQAKRGFEQRPLTEQISERTYDALARSGAYLSRAARQTAGAAVGASEFMAGKPYRMADFPQWRAFEEERNRELEERRLARPSSLATEIGEGVIEGAPIVAAGGLLTAAGVPAPLVGGGMAAASIPVEEWQRAPGRSALQTGLGAAAPYVGGQLTRRAINPLASRIASPVAQQTAKVGGEFIGGGAANVAQAAAMGERSPRELTKQFAVGGTLAVPGAMATARQPLSRPQPAQPALSTVQPGVSVAAPRVQPQTGTGLANLGGAARAMGENFRQMLRDSVARNGRLPSQERNSAIGRAFEAAVAGGAPRDVTTLDAVMLATQGGAVRQPAAARRTAEIPRAVQTAPDTARIQYPDAQTTQESPALSQWMLRENAPTAELPAVAPRPPIRQTREIPQRPSFVRPTAEIPRPSEPVTQPTQAPAVTLPAPRRPRTERLPVPRATPENIEELRRRREELSRLAYDRRGNFTGDLRDEYRELGSRIAEYDNEQLTPGERRQQDAQRLADVRYSQAPAPEEKAGRRAALQPRAEEFLEASTTSRPVTRETQLPPGLKISESHATREDARQGHFERFDDQELVDEIRRMEDVRNQKIRGRSRLTPEQLEANDFDLRVAVEMQKERRRLQEQIGIDPAQRIAPRTPARPAGRRIQHTAFGEVTEAPNQKGVPTGKLRVMDADGAQHLIQNPRTRGNREAAFVKSTGAIPAEAMPELRASNAPPSPLAGRQIKTGPKTSYAIPSEAMPELRGKTPDILRGMKKLMRSLSSPVEVSKLREQFPKLSKADFDKEMARLNEEGTIALHRHDHPASLSEAQRNNLIKIGNDYFNAATIREGKGHYMGGIFGALQPLLKNVKLPSRAEASETAGGVQTVAQLGNPRFVIRNIVQHVAFGKQERTATRLAAAIDWAYSKASGKGRQIAAPKGSDLASYVRNWGAAIRAYKAGQPLPGGHSAIAHTANANKIDRGVQKLMTWMNEIPDAANWQTRFEDSLQSIVRKGRNVNMQDAIDQATMEANRASLRDPNFVSVALLKIKEGLNKASSPIFGTDKFGAGDFIMKYAQTPGALLKRGLERSPLGLFQVAKEAATPGPFRRRNTLLALSRVAEGAATGAGLGAALAAAGVLVGPEEESRTGQALEREEGVRGYSFNASALLRLLTGESGAIQEGDTLYSIDWLQPWAMNLSAGAALWNLHKDGQLGPKEGAKEAGKAVYDSLAKTLDIMGDQSVLKNLNRYIGRAEGDTFADKILSFVRAVGVDVPSSFVPSLARQTRQVADPFERDVRPEQRGGVGGFVEEAKNRALAQLPGVSESFPKRPSLLTGEDKKTALGEMGVGSRIGAQFSPANVSTYTPRPVAREISRLNRAGEKVDVSFPRATTNKKTGEREPTSSLRGRERRFTEAFSRMSAELIADPFYKDADNETKAEAFVGLKRHLANLGKEDFEEKMVEEIIEAAMETVEKRRAKEEE